MARKGNMYKKEIHSSYLNETIALKIYEPETFDGMYENNVCIMQDGNDYFNIGRVATVSDRLHEEGDIVNTTFVGIPYKDRYDRWKKYHPGGEQFAAYKLFLREEVVSLLDDILPLNPLGTVRTLIGDSLGATVSLLTALEDPNVFHRVIMQSPYVNDDVIDAVENFSHPRTPEIYHSFGLAEVDVPTTKMGRLNFVEPNERLVEVLQAKFPTYEYKTIPEGNHTWTYWQKELPDLLVHVLG